MSEYQKLQEQANELQAKANEVFNAERTEKIEAIKLAIDVYQLTPKELFKSARGAAKAKGEARPAAYADGNGGTWGGRGPRPAWLRAALEAGHTLEEFAV